MDRGELHSNAPGLLKSPSEFLQRDVWVRLDHLDEEIHMRSQLPGRTSSATLWLGLDGSPLSMICGEPDRSGSTHPEDPARRTSRMPRQNIVNNTMAKIQRVRFAHDAPPRESESWQPPHVNPQTIHIKRKLL